MAKSLSGTVGLLIKGFDVVFSERVTPTASTMTKCVLPVFADSTDEANTLKQFSPGVDLIAELDAAGLLLNYLSEYQQLLPQEGNPSMGSGDVFFGDGNVLRIDADFACAEESCDSLASIENVTITPDTLSAEPVTIGQLSRTHGPSVIPIF